jgi:hypothetical protein
MIGAKLLGEGYSLSLPADLGGKMVTALMVFEEECPECNLKKPCKHLKLDCVIEDQLVCLCQCDHCGFVWYLRDETPD